ncbi:hypothetical protein A4X03_0g7859 [Tilletia caries]|uniref:Protein kinase domain-containing protein n=1 Tax=Tilletia caries TaxID=13290 RepID=A0A8T8SM83_9BASI|nr:hypothetical protein A4X03_0g7859 [Tilletia caries]
MPKYWGSLQDLLDTAQGRELRLSTAKNLTHQILVVVTHIHENDVVHLDIKPDNILLSDSGAVKISDFGLAVEAGTGQDMRTAGTVGYTAPECLMGFRRPTFQNDVCSTGCVIADMFLGDTLFSYDSPEQCMRDILRSTCHPDGPVLPRSNYPPSDPDTLMPSSYKAVQPNASTRLQHLVPEAADLILVMLKLQPNRRPHLATFLEHPLFTPGLGSDYSRAFFGLVIVVVVGVF